ncbi:MAG: entericidin A/B family lipoprotein [Pseudomonadota bacterium]
MKQNWIILMVLANALGLSACHTIEGAGKDIESGGEVIQEESRDVRQSN